MGVILKEDRLSTVERPIARRWTVDEYHHAGDAGLFGFEERLELLNGEIIRKMSPQGTSTCFCRRSDC